MPFDSAEIDDPMNPRYKKPEAAWSGTFGNQYTHRQRDIVSSNTALFARALRNAPALSSVIELGAGAGMNIRALRHLIPMATLHAVEMNPVAAESLRLVSDHVIEGSVLDMRPSRRYDLVLTKGLLIHIHPDKLNELYITMHELSRAFILICEYYNPTPVEVVYRGEQGLLWKRDFAGEMLDRFPDLSLSDYGFVSKRDRNFPQDDINWWLLEKIL